MYGARVFLLAGLALGLEGALAGSALAQGLVSTSSTAGASVSGGQRADHQVLIESMQSRLDALAGRVELLDDRMALLRDTALGGVIARTRAILIHRNALGNAFELERARYTLDGGVLLDKIDANGSLSGLEELVLFDGRIGPGEHVLEAELVCRGGGFGLFSYVEAYRFRVTSRYVMKVREGRVNRLEIVAYQRPDITLPAPKRLTIRYDYEVLGGPAADESP